MFHRGIDCTNTAILWFDSSIRFEITSIPNRVPFSGVLTRIDEVSDKAPSGPRGHRVLLTGKAAEEALHTVIGMAVDYKAGWDGHDARQKVGIITEGVIVGNDLIVRGYLFSRDYPEMLLLDFEKIGMSYELADARIADFRKEIWTITKATFTGAAILFKKKAAYYDTSFRVHKGTAPYHYTSTRCVVLRMPFLI